ncbi:MAG: hypothetical protein MUE69_03095 [Myxococcota bacterium]|jgi:hypothetical protein|nr:hypothetical protein [Myxococcota bacterium]
MKISLGVLLGVLGAATVASAQDPFARDTVIVVEHADGPSPTVTEIPYQPPTPASESALALDAPVVLILPPGTQVRVLDAELAPPVPEPPRVATPIAPPQIPAPQVAATALQLEARLAELRRQRPGLGLSISLVAGGAFALGISSVALVEANFDCSWDDDCGRVRWMRGVVLASFATMTVGIVRLVINIIRRSRNSREIRAVRQELAAITHGTVLTWR